MKLNTVIILDKKTNKHDLHFLIQENCSDIKIIGHYNSYEEAQKLIDQNTIHLIFLDISLLNIEDIDLFTDLNRKQLPIVFLAESIEYAYYAIKAGAIDYLIMPVTLNNLEIAIEKAKVNFSFKEYKEQYKGYAKKLSNDKEIINLTENKISKITIPASTGFQLIETTSIIYIEADNNYSIFYLLTGKSVISSKPLKDYEEILSNDNFTRIHKSFIINLKYLNSYQTQNGFSVNLINNITLQVSRRRIPDFLERVKLAFANKQEE